MKVIWQPQAAADYQARDTDRQYIRKINQLIENIQETPFQGLGHPEPLKHEWSGWWSRRITGPDRLVYRVTPEGVLEIARLPLPLRSLIFFLRFLLFDCLLPQSSQFALAQRWCRSADDWQLFHVDGFLMLHWARQFVCSSREKEAALMAAPHAHALVDTFG